jgi:hypothetical protein
MKTVSATIIISLSLIGIANARDGARDTALIEQVSPANSYDYAVHVRNTHAIGYNPEVREDRQRMALKALRGQCRTARVVGENKIKREIWGITSTLPDYVVLVKCS